MIEPTENYEVEAQENNSLGGDLLAEDQESLRKAMVDCIEVFSAPGQADLDETFEIVETLEELLLCLSDTKVSDQVGELIEILNEICDEKVLSFEDAQRGKLMVQNLARLCGFHVAHFSG